MTATHPACSLPVYYERARREVFTVVHGIMDAMENYPEEDPDEWQKAAEQAVWWHSDLRNIHYEFNQDELEQEALDEY